MFVQNLLWDYIDYEPQKAISYEMKMGLKNECMLGLVVEDRMERND